MNPYLPLSTHNVHQNNIPPRLMWNINDNVWTNSTSGYCGETSLQCAGLLYGQYIPQYLIRQQVIDFYASLTDTQFQQDFGNPVVQSPIHPKESVTLSPSNIQQYGQYCCQVLLSQPGDGNGLRYALEKLRFNIDAQQDIYTGSETTQNHFVPWLKQRVLAGQPVIIGLQDNLPGSNDSEYDHIVIVTGWGSNHALTDNCYYADDEILFSDHGLVVTGGSMPYYFHYVMQSAANGTRPDGGCPGTTVWNFIMDTGTKRTVDQTPCNTYQLALVPSQIAGNSPKNYAVAIGGVMGSQLLPVRIDTDYNYEFPCITTAEAWNGTDNPPTPPATNQTMTHTVTISGLTVGTSYNIWVYKDLSQVPKDNFNSAGTGERIAHTATATAYMFTLQASANTPVIVRCVPQSA